MYLPYHDIGYVKYIQSSKAYLIK